MFAGKNEFTQRSFSHAWDLGHIVIFCFWTVLLIPVWSWFGRKKPQWQFIILTATVIAVSLSIEYIQLYAGRIFSVSDIRKNLAGCVLGFCLYRPEFYKNTAGKYRWARIAVIAMIFFETLPFIKSVADEVTACLQFPVLSNFETPFELDRWSGSSSRQLDHSVKSQGRSSMQIEFGTEKYSDANLYFMPGHWNGFQSLRFDLYNPDRTPIQVMCCVNDLKHIELGYQFEDRFNRRIKIESGPRWHTVEISLNDIRTAPAKRFMNMNRIDNMALFTHQLDRKRTLYIDAVRLVP
ncbi:MAG: VanZ family protein [Desulfobacteraceae bacterium]|nr:VanZ family protein [Desulfobacteraceae bacterium]